VALLGLIDAILVFPGEGCGEMPVQWPGDLAACLQLVGATDARKPALLLQSGHTGIVLGSSDAGTRKQLYLLLIG
jgi:hypothetical protein